MIDIFFFNSIFLFLITFMGLGFAFWVYLSNPKERINQLFSLFTIFNLLWIIFTYLSDVSNLPGKINLAILFRNLAYGSVFLFFISVYFFVKDFFKIQRNKILDGVVLVTGLILFFIAVFTRFIVKGVEPRVWGNYPVFGGGIFFAYGIIIFLTILILVTVIRRYLSLPEKEKLKAQYFLFGTLIFASGNFIFNIILAPKWTNFPYYYFGNYSTIFLLGFTAYAIVKKELFGIKVVFTSLLIGAIGLVLVLQILIAPNYVWRIVDVIIFLLFCLFAYYLLGAVQQEEKNRERAELIAIREMALRQKAEKLTGEFKRLDEAKTQFMLATQHHLRTPLTSVQGYLSMILEGTYGKISEKAKPKIKNALDATQRLIKLVNEFLDVAQFEVGKETMAKREVQIEEVFDEVVDELKTIARERNLYVRFEKPIRPAPAFAPPPLKLRRASKATAGKQGKPIQQVQGKPAESLPFVMADPEKLKEAIYNVVFNGIKYTERGGVVINIKYQKSNIKNEDLTDTSEVKSVILITIKDTGIGMERDEIAGLFAKTFERGEQAKKLYTTGRGIGLYLAYQIIKAHGGRLWAESEGRGKGSTFYIELPLEY